MLSALSDKLLGAGAPRGYARPIETLDEAHETKKTILLDLRRCRDEIRDLQRQRSEIDARLRTFSEQQRTLEARFREAQSQERDACQRFIEDTSTAGVASLVVSTLAPSAPAAATALGRVEVCDLEDAGPIALAEQV